MSEGTIKQVKVDNWGIFFLQRLQALYAKSEHCDLVLQFSTNEKIKVHRLVLNACTEYFQVLEKQGHINGDCLQMPADLQSDVVIPIINFMYTGKLEFRTELHKRLYSTAQQLNMTVLTKLLDAQNAVLPPQIKPVIRRQTQLPVTYNLQGKKITPKQIDPDLPETLPGRKLPIWKRRNVPTNVPTYYEDSSSYSLYDSPSKMPSSVIDESPRPTRFEWPEENVETQPYSSTFADLSYETKPIVKPCIPLITNKQLAAKAETSNRVATFEEICRTATNVKRLHSSPSFNDETSSKKVKLDLQAVKELVQEHRLRKVLLDTSEENGEEVDDDLAVADLDDDDDMDDEDGELPFEEISDESSIHHAEEQVEQQELQLELQPQQQNELQIQHHQISQVTQQLKLDPQEQQQQHHLQETEEALPCPQQVAIDLPEQQQLSVHAIPTTVVLPESLPVSQIQVSAPTPIQTTSSIQIQTPVQMQITVPQQTPIRQSVLPPQKSILKAQGSHEESVPSTPVSVASKKVRFLLDAKSPEGKENTATTASTPKIRRNDDGQRPLPTRAENIASIGGPVANTGNLSNHAKIITEVLKKYPHLVKNNKNIRLKIMQRGGAQVAPMVAMDGDASKMVKSKVSYVVLKSDVAGKGKPAVVLKHGGLVEPLSELGGQKPASGAENTTGPWLCHSCGSNEEPIHFETYYLYRRHLQDVHMEKIDARICEHCGHRASKRNLLLYHLYTKHGVPPPRNCQFPKCDQCDYVALSESLLIKHRNSHSNNKEFVCKVCNAAFKSNGALQGHMQTNLHSDPAKKLYECPFCQKPFVRNINLKAHIRTSHKEVIRKIDEEERLHIEGKRKQFGTLQQFEDGEEAHSSDAIGDESLNAEGEEVEMMEVPVIDAVMQKQGTGTVMLPSGVTVLAEAPAIQQSLVPSSEAEALSNVASGIAASLGLADTLTGEQTVILLDDSQEFILQSTEVVGEETTCTEGKDDETVVGTELQEYIVPDMMPEGSQEQTNSSYGGPLTDLEHYSEETQGHSTITVTESQTATAPPPVSVAVSMIGGDEVTMVLTDHDYAPIRDSNGERVMLFIARPSEQPEQNQILSSVNTSESELPVLEKEPEPPLLTAEPSETVVEDVKFNTMPPVLIRETDSPRVIEDRLNERLTSEVSGGMSSTSETSLIPGETLTQVVQLNATEETNQGQEINHEVVVALSQQYNEEEQLRIPETAVSVEDVVQHEELREGNDVVVHETMEAAVSVPVPVEKPIAHSTPVRRQPPVQMADIMKEWDDFDDEDEGVDEHSSHLHESQHENKPVIVGDDEPRVLRGPVSDISE